MPFSKQGVDERLRIGKVGVDLELCVHAHGPDVELIMEASCENNNPLVISSSGRVPILTSAPLWIVRSIVGFHPTSSLIFNNLVSLSIGI